MITAIITTDEELKAIIMLEVRGEQWGVQIDNHITPLYCCNCKKQLDNLYKLDGSRYGHVGTVTCQCGAEISCVDSDNIVEYLDTTTTFENEKIGSYYIDFKNIYRLNNSSWTFIKENIGYDILSEHKGQTVNLEDVINEISARFNLTVDNSVLYSSDRFNKLPIIINKWFTLLNSIDNTATNNVYKSWRLMAWLQKLFS
jgi:hypothetical protein